MTLQEYKQNRIMDLDSLAGKLSVLLIEGIDFGAVDKRAYKGYLEETNSDRAFLAETEGKE